MAETIRGIRETELVRLSTKWCMRAEMQQAKSMGALCGFIFKESFGFATEFFEVVV